MKIYQPTPRGRYVRAHPRRHPSRSNDYVKVPAYQEEADRLRATLKQLAELQMRFQFLMPQQPEQVGPDNQDAGGSAG
jgi:hypothetical protein